MGLNESDSAWRIVANPPMAASVYNSFIRIIGNLMKTYDALQTP